MGSGGQGQAWGRECVQQSRAKGASGTSRQAEPLARNTPPFPPKIPSKGADSVGVRSALLAISRGGSPSLEFYKGKRRVVLTVYADSYFWTHSDRDAHDDS